ncbi:hypothetical protein BMS3Bbin03_02227 [bacterium BMS3Bbin03]|nr:hypothetical protein BMS3Bbin03_02227 [bacterium BMS3Bbin03]
MIKKIVQQLFVGLLLLLFASIAFATDKTDSGSKLYKSLTSRSCRYIDVNQIRSSVMNNGTFTRNPISGDADMVWPKGSGKTICYNAGIWIAGKVNGDIRTAAADYNVEFQPGLILPDGTADDPEKPEYRVYKVNKNYPDGNDALQIDSWNIWETYAEKQGAPPVEDKDGNWIGFGDEMLSAVMNDLNQTLHNGCYNTLPIGIELHLLVFGFDQAGALGNTIFIRYTMINKGKNDLKQAYIGSWADVDLGDANDDLIGYDMNLGMSYAYNGKPVDKIYGSRPPAIGWDFFQGPIIDSPGDTVKLPNGRIYPDKKELGATSFNKYYNGNPVYTDPSYDAAGALMVWNYLSGRQKDGTPWKNPLTGEVTTFLDTGDPVTGTGWLSTAESPPADIRMLTGTGPFTLAVGDTQRIVVGCVIGQGSDRLSSISVLRFYDQQAQQAYNSGFHVASPPPAPEVSVSELNRKVLLTWKKNAENFVSKYKFEGYNVYIGDSPGGPWKRLATFDVPNKLAVILEPSYDTNSGQILDLPAAYGNNLGLQYRYLVTKDYEKNALANGRAYYVAVTSYAYSATSIPKVLESSRTVLTVVPHRARPGTEYSNDAFQTVKIEHSAGDASPRNYEVWAEVVDPLRVKTANYKITINKDSTWTLWRNGTAVPGYTNHAVEDTIYKDITYQTLQGSPIDFFLGLTVNFNKKKLNTWEPELIKGDSSLINRLTSPYRLGIRKNDLAYDGQFKRGTKDSSLFMDDLQIRFTGVWDSTSRTVSSGGSMATLLFGFADPAFFIANHPANPNPGSRNPFLVRVPFEIWDIKTNTQLNAAFTDFSQKLSDSLFVPTWAPRGNCRVYVVASPYDEQVHNIGYTGQDTMATWTFIFKDSTIWKTGDIVQLNIPNPDTFPKPVVAGKDEFTFRLQGKTTGVLSNEKKRLDIINVFPNPYLGYNITENDLHQDHVTFINLPIKCTIRIFTISGQLIKTIKFDNPNSTTYNWYLQNEDNLPVASGFYIAYIDVPNVGQKILKMVIVLRQQRLKNL